MTLTELRYIVALSQTGHFGKAAEQCCVSQPSLSLAVKKLEEELGIAIFERSKSRIALTPTGETIVEQAKVVLHEAAQVQSLADAGRDPLGSQLAIGAIHTVGPYLFPSFISALHRLAPDMPLYVEENFTAGLRRRLTSGELDVAILALPFTEPDIVTQKVYEEPFVVLLPTDHPLAKHKKISSEQLEEERVLLLGAGHCFRDQVLAACPRINKPNSRADAQMQSVVEGSSLETLKHMVASGLGITVLPKSAAVTGDYSNGNLITRPLDDASATRTIALAWRASFPRHQAIDAVSQAIKQSLKR